MSIISQMNFQNPWWADKGKIHEDSGVMKAVASKPRFFPSISEQSTLIMGPRQVGKTTFMKTTIMKLLDEGVEPTSILFFSCDSLRDRKQLIELLHDYRSFINSGSAHIFLDEITFVREWNDGLLALFNAGYLNNSITYVSGSASIFLKRETLPGRPIRKVIYYPLNFRAYFDLFFKKISSAQPQLHNVDAFYREAVKLVPYMDELNRALLGYIRKGGFLACNYASGDPLGSLYETYRDAVLSDMARLGRDEIAFRAIMERVVRSYGSRISEQTIARETSIGSHNTVASYLELAEDLFIIRTFRKIENGRENLRSFRKIYFVDPFIYRVMKQYTTGAGNIEENEIPHIIEGVVGEHLARENRNTGYTFFRGGREIDFVVGKTGIEVKWRKGELGDLKSDSGYVLSFDNIDSEMGKAVLPASIFLYLTSSGRVFYEL